MLTTRIKDIPKVCGVYRLYNTTTGQSYVGASGNVRMRIGKHRWGIRTRKCDNHRIQEAFPNGLAELRFELLEQCTPAQLYACECKWIQAIDNAINFIDTIDWGQVDWSLSDAEIAERVGRSEGSVYHKRAELGAARSPVQFRLGGVDCPNCGSANLRIVESRRTEGRGIRRRRRCDDCGKIVTTHEMIVEDDGNPMDRGWTRVRTA